MMFIDRETGENLEESFYNIQSIILNDSRNNNVETGEPEGNNSECFGRRTPFQIPKEFKRQSSVSSRTKEDEVDIRNNKLNKKNRYYNKNIISITQGTYFAQINPIFLFLLAIIYFKWFAAILALFEVILHRWAHHKNKSLKDCDVYYRSPFHGVTSEFCALCQHETRMNRVGKMQQIRMYKFLQHCHYMKRAVT